MQRKTSLSLVGLVLATAFLLNACATSDAPAVTQTDASRTAGQSKKTLKPHSHLEEKLGQMPKSEVTKQDEPTANKPNPATDKSKHFHPRDGK